MIDNVRLAEIDKQTEESEVSLNEVQEELNQKVETLKEVKGGLQAWKEYFNASMVDEFIAYGNQILRPCLDYYQKTLRDQIDIYRLWNSATAVQI